MTRERVPEDDELRKHDLQIEDIRRPDWSTISYNTSHTYVLTKPVADVAEITHIVVGNDGKDTINLTGVELWIDGLPGEGGVLAYQRFFAPVTVANDGSDDGDPFNAQVTLATFDQLRTNPNWTNLYRGGGWGYVHPTNSRLWIPRFRGHNAKTMKEMLNAIIMDGLQQDPDARSHGAFLRDQTKTIPWTSTDDKLGIEFRVRVNDNTPQIECTMKFNLKLITVDAGNNVVAHNDNHDLGTGVGQIARTFLSVDGMSDPDCGMSKTGWFLTFFAQRILDIPKWAAEIGGVLIDERLRLLAALYLLKDIDVDPRTTLKAIEDNLLVGFLATASTFAGPPLARLDPPYYFCFPSVSVNHQVSPGFIGGLTVCDPRIQ